MLSFFKEQVTRILCYQSTNYLMDDWNDLSDLNNLTN
jgi:hypothetical protein